MKSKGIFKAVILFWGLEYLFFDAIPWYSISPLVQASIIISSILVGIVMILARRPRRL